MVNNCKSVIALPVIYFSEKKLILHGPGYW